MDIHLDLAVCPANQRVNYRKEYIGDEPVMGKRTWDDPRWEIHSIFTDQPHAERLLQISMDQFRLVGMVEGVIVTERALIYMQRPVLFVISLEQDIVYENREWLSTFSAPKKGTYL